MCLAVCWWFAASTQLHTKSQLGRQHCRAVINNCPFVPFLPRLFLFPGPLSLLAQSLPSTNCLHFSSASQFSNMLRLLLTSLSSFLRKPFVPSFGLLSFLTHYCVQVRVKSLCPTFSEMGPFPAVPQRVCVSVHSQIIMGTPVWVSKNLLLWKGLLLAHTESRDFMVMSLKAADRHVNMSWK